MIKYKKKPVVIEAFQFGVDEIPQWYVDKVFNNEIVHRENDCLINTLEGVMKGEYGDYIIKGINGEIYPCKKEIFLQTYEKC